MPTTANSPVGQTVVDAEADIAMKKKRNPFAELEECATKYVQLLCGGNVHEKLHTLPVHFFSSAIPFWCDDSIARSNTTSAVIKYLEPANFYFELPLLNPKKLVFLHGVHKVRGAFLRRPGDESKASPNHTLCARPSMPMAQDRFGDHFGTAALLFLRVLFSVLVAKLVIVRGVVEKGLGKSSVQKK